MLARNILIRPAARSIPTKANPALFNTNTIGLQWRSDYGTVLPVGQLLADEGGNTIMLRLRSGTPEELAHRSLKLHGFWDNDAVMANLVSLPLTVSKEERQDKTEKAKRQLVERLSREQPANWRLPRDLALEKYAEAWADEILPIARQAHERLEFNKVHPQLDQHRYVSVGIAEEKIVPGRIVYADWAAGVVREELHKAGWRLADLLEKATSTTTTATSASIPPAPPILTLSNGLLEPVKTDRYAAIKPRFSLRPPTFCTLP